MKEKRVLENYQREIHVQENWNTNTCTTGNLWKKSTCIGNLCKKNTFTEIYEIDTCTWNILKGEVPQC